MAKVLMAINEEDNSISNLAKALTLQKSEVVVLALNLLNYTMDQRKNGMHLTLSKDGKTADILNEATAGNVAFKLNN